MVVDDHFPCSKKSGQPLFAKPKDQELWVMIYEKAFAKYCGSYHGCEQQRNCDALCLFALSYHTTHYSSQQNCSGPQRPPANFNRIRAPGPPSLSGPQ